MDSDAGRKKEMSGRGWKRRKGEKESSVENGAKNEGEGGEGD